MCEIVKRVLTASEVRHVFVTCQHVLCLVCGVKDKTVCVCVRKCGSLCACVNMFLCSHSHELMATGAHCAV